MATNENSGDNISKESEESSDSELSGSELDVSSDQDTIIDVFTESSNDDRPNIGCRWGGGLQF